jgi:hypothetical protein
MVLSVSALNAQTRTSIKLTDLPKAITDNISTAHQGWTASEAFKVDTKGVMTYEVLVKKAMSQMNLIYDKDGKYLKMEPKKMASNKPAKSSGSTPAKPESNKKTK